MAKMAVQTLGAKAKQGERHCLCWPFVSFFDDRKGVRLMRDEPAKSHRPSRSRITSATFQPLRNSSKNDAPAQLVALPRRRA